MKCFYTVDGNTKYSVVRQQHIGKPLVFPWLHATLFHCWRLHPGEQYKGNLLLRFHVSNADAKAPQYYMNNVSFVEMVTSWRGISLLLYLLPSTQYFIAFINMLHVSAPLMNRHQGTSLLKLQVRMEVNIWHLRGSQTPNIHFHKYLCFK